VEWGVSAWLLRVKEREQAKEHDLLYMGGVGGSVRGSGATDLRTYLLIHAGIWNLNWEGGATGAQNTIPNNSNPKTQT